MITKEGFLIRPLEKRDREQVREIFRQGGQRGNPLASYIEDEEIILRPLVDYYIDHEPECCVVAEAEGKVVAFALGTKNNRRYNRIILTRYIPKLIARVIWRTLTLRYRTRKNYVVIWWFLTRAWREIPEAPFDKYPGGLHLTLSNEYRGYRLGRQLINAMDKMFRRYGLPGAHGVVVEEAHRNVFSRTLDVDLLETKRTTLWRHCSSDEWDFKLLSRTFN